jgi:hypothetical protein
MFVLSKFFYNNANSLIFWFFGSVSVVNIVFGAFSNDPRIHEQLLTLPFPMLALCVGHLFWKKINNGTKT